MQNRSRIKETAVWAITPNGIRIAETLCSRMSDCHRFMLYKFERQKVKSGISYFESLSKALEESFFKFKNHIFIFSTGIAVRMIAPLIRSKLTDPAVVVVDDSAHFSVSLLSGHIGGANALAETVAGIIGAVAVITTATDQNHLPAIDMIAKKADLHIETPENIKRVNAAFLAGREISIFDEHDILNNKLDAQFRVLTKDAATNGLDVFCSYRLRPVSRETLILRPKILYIGIGCNRGTKKGQIQDFLLTTLNNKKISAHSIAAIATADIKKTEAGLTELSEHLNVNIEYYTKEQLNGADGIQTPSDMAKKHLGINSVCEAAAILSSGNGKLIVTKTKNKEVTIAVAVKK